MASKATLEYRAIVAFYLDGVPHHAAGTWQASKVRAKRDAADRALGLFVALWGEELQRQGESKPGTTSFDVWQGRGDCDDSSPEERLLENFCKQLPACSGGQLEWIMEPEHPEVYDAPDVHINASGRCFAIVEINLLGVPHKLAGAVKSTAKEARADTARRALWYLQCPGYEDIFEAEKLVGRGTSGKAPAEIGEIQAPPGGWVCDDSSQEALDEAKRKTIVMRVQNRLQQEFARQLQPGQGVWEWTYSADPNDEQWPPLFQATVRVHVLEEEFVGDWVRGQREATIDAINRVSAYLDDIAGGKQKGRAGQRRSQGEIAVQCQAFPQAGTIKKEL
jgi:hypothetical protein